MCLRPLNLPAGLKTQGIRSPSGVALRGYSCCTWGQLPHTEPCRAPSSHAGPRDVRCCALCPGSISAKRGWSPSRTNKPLGQLSGQSAELPGRRLGAPGSGGKGRGSRDGVTSSRREPTDLATLPDAKGLPAHCLAFSFPARLARLSWGPVSTPTSAYPLETHQSTKGFLSSHF